MLLPALGKARELSRQTVCTNNLKNIGLAFLMYASHNDGFFPAAEDPVSSNPYYWLWMGRGWRRMIEPYLSGSLDVLYCPSDRTAPEKWESTSYGYSMALYHSPGQINAMTKKADTYSNPRQPIPQRIEDVQYPSQKALCAEWLSNHKKVDDDQGWWCWKGSRNVLFVDCHVKYFPATRVRPANDEFPDFSLTVDGSRGQDVE